LTYLIAYGWQKYWFAGDFNANGWDGSLDYEEKDWDGIWSVNKIWYNLGCPHIFSTERPIHSQQKWKQAIDIFHAIVGDGHLDPLKNGFSVGIEAKQTEGKGRGIYATHPIKNGELVWSSKRTAMFDDGDDYRHFLSVLDVDFACDVLQWAYVQDVSDSDEHQELQISVDLDEGCFCNDGGDGEPSSVGCDEDEAVNFEGGCRSNYFALRDIEAGEELLCNYDEFALPDGWKEFGLDLPNSIWLEGIWS